MKIILTLTGANLGNNQEVLQTLAEETTMVSQLGHHALIQSI